MLKRVAVDLGNWVIVEVQSLECRGVAERVARDVSDRVALEVNLGKRRVAGKYMVGYFGDLVVGEVAEEE